MKAYIIIVDSEVELAPEQPKREKDEFDTLGSFRDMPVLDAYFHQNILSKMPESERRGRPDIVHKCLSLCQNSIANRKGSLRVFVHTREDKVIKLSPNADIPPNYVEFIGDMGKLLKGQTIKDMELSSMTLTELLDHLKPDHILALSPKGEETKLNAVLESWKDTYVAILIGGFPEGDYKSPVYQVAEKVVSLGPILLTSPSVLSEVLSAMPRK